MVQHVNVIYLYSLIRRQGDKKSYFIQQSNTWAIDNLTTNSKICLYSSQAVKLLWFNMC